jgi:hypothetical protein
MRDYTLKTLKWLCCFVGLLCLMTPQQANATHSMGLDLTYAPTANANEYQVTLTFYRDCNGVNAPSTPTVNWSAVCGTGSALLQQISKTEITPACPGIVGTACNGGNGVYGIEEYVYQGLVTFPAGCTDVKLSFGLCCRNGAITTLANPLSEKLYVEAIIGDASLNNQSPVFTNVPVPFGCVGQPVFYNHGATDADGDNLVYSLTQCYDALNTPVVYGAGFSATTPLATTNGVAIDSNTGAISFTPNVAQVGVLCVLVEEFRNGVKIGEIVRDIQFTAVPCSNNVPTLSGIDNTTDYSTTATAGTQVCFDVFSNDVDVNQSTFLTWNAGIAGATFTSAGSPFANGTFCWTPGANDVGVHTFTVNVSDDYCPIVGQNTYTFTINVEAPAPPPCDSIDVNIVSTADLACANNDGSATILAANGVAPYTYQVVNWTTNDFFTNTTGTFNNLTAGTYSIWVQDANGCTPACTGHVFTIGGNTTPLTATVTAEDVNCPSNSINTRDSLNQDGSVTAQGAGGVAPYLYSIDGTTFQNSGAFNNLGTGTYTVVVMDANGCSEIVTATVGEPDPIAITVVSLTDETCGQSDGSVTLAATGGDGNYLYYINGQSQSSPTFTGLAAGTYTFSVCDMRYCLYHTTITIGGGPSFTATINTTSPSCNGDCDGTATVAVSGTNNTTVLWSNGATGATIGNLCAGTYTAVVTDANGCEVTVSATITEPDPISVAIASTSDESCQGNDGAATLTIAGGTAAYNVSLANFTQGTTVSNTTGAFTGLNAGQYVVNVTDANGCSESCATHFSLEGCTTTGNPDPTVIDGTGANGGTTISIGTLGFFRVNPNPASTMIQAAYQTQERQVGISILDAAGQTVYTKEGLANEGSLEIMINNWSEGNYFVVLRGETGKVIKTQKMTINK